MVIQQALNSLQLGSIYALIALGYTMVYGVLRLINFAHGDVFMVGSYAALFLAVSLHCPLLVILPLTFVAIGASGSCHRTSGLSAAAQCSAGLGGHHRPCRRAFS